jgi:DoxX-like family
MSIAGLIIVSVTAVANAGAAAADLGKADFVLKVSDEVGVSHSWLPLLAGLKAAGAAGLLMGLIGFHVVGVAAAAGLVIFFIGAVIAHIRARVFYNIAFPGLYLALASASLALSMSQ